MKYTSLVLFIALCCYATLGSDGSSLKGHSQLTDRSSSHGPSQFIGSDGSSFQGHSQLTDRSNSHGPSEFIENDKSAIPPVPLESVGIQESGRVARSIGKIRSQKTRNGSLSLDKIQPKKKDKIHPKKKGNVSLSVDKPHATVLRFPLDKANVTVVRVSLGKNQPQQIDNVSWSLEKIRPHKKERVTVSVDGSNAAVSVHLKKIRHRKPGNFSLSVGKIRSQKRRNGSLSLGKTSTTVLRIPLEKIRPLKAGIINLSVDRTNAAVPAHLKKNWPYKSGNFSLSADGAKPTVPRVPHARKKSAVPPGVHLDANGAHKSGVSGSVGHRRQKVQNLKEVFM